MGKVIEVSDGNLQKAVLESDVPVEVDFWAPWCGPCRMVAPIYDKLATEYDNFKFCKVNVDENRETAQRYEVMSIPELLHAGIRLFSVAPRLIPLVKEAVRRATATPKPA